MVTLSRQTHTSVIIEKDGEWYIYEAHVTPGVYVEKIDIDKYIKYIENNEVDVYRRRKITDTPDMALVDGVIKDLESIDEKMIVIGKYSIAGLFNQFLINVFGKSVIKETNAPYKAICSELTSHYFTDSKRAYWFSPHSISDSDAYQKMI